MTSDQRVQFKLMLPAGLKVALEERAHVNRRSLSAEIIDRLTESLTAETGAHTVAIADMEQIVERVVRRIRAEEGAR